MAIEKEQSRRRRPNSMYRSSVESRRKVCEFYPEGDCEHDTILHLNGNEPKSIVSLTTVYSSEDWEDDYKNVYHLEVLETCFRHLTTTQGMEEEMTYTYEPSFLPYLGWIRNPAGDQPELISPATGEVPSESANLYVMPQQIGFITPCGAEVQMSAERAVKLGLISEFTPERQWLDEYSQSTLDSNSQIFPHTPGEFPTDTHA